MYPYSIKIQLQEACHNTLSSESFFLECWKALGFLIRPVDRRKHPLGTSVKFPSRYYFSNPVKTPPLSLFLEPWRMLGFLMSLQMVSYRGSILWKLLWNLYQDWTSGTQSRLHLSSKSLTWVLEDIEIPDEPVYGVRRREHPLEASVKFSSRLDIRNEEDMELPDEPGDGVR